MEYLFTKTPLVWALQSYWRDEAFSVILSQKPFLQLIQITANDFSPPLYYFILKIWIYFFGNSEIATRAFSVLMFFGLIFVSLRFLRTILNLSKFNTAIVTLLICFSPIFTYYAFETRMYSMIAFLSAYSWLALLSGKRKTFVVMSVLGLYTHYSQIFIFVSQLLYILIQDDKNFRLSISSAKLGIKNWSREIVGITVAYLPWVLYFISQHTDISSQGFWTAKPKILSLIHLPAILLTGYENDFWFSYNFSSITLSVVVLFSTIYYLLRRNGQFGKQKYNRLFWAFIIWLVVPGLLIFLIAQVGPSLFVPRYMIVSTISIYFAIGFALKRFNHPALYLFIVIFFWQCNSYQEIQIKNRTKDDVAKVMKFVNTHTSPNDYLLLESELDFHLAQLYFKNPDKVYIVGKKYEDLPRYIGKSLIPSNQVFEHVPPDLTGYWYTNSREIRTIK